MLVLAAAAVAVSGGDESVPPAPATMLATDSPVAAYRAQLAPLLRAASVEAHSLVALGESRSRNLFAIQSAQDRMEDRLDAVDGALTASPPPSQLEEAFAAYRSGAGTVRRAMGEAQAGFLRLDWDRVARAIELLARGAALLDRATALLGGDDTSSPSTPP